MANTQRIDINPVPSQRIDVWWLLTGADITTEIVYVPVSYIYYVLQTDADVHFNSFSKKIMKVFFSQILSKLFLVVNMAIYQHWLR